MLSDLFINTLILISCTFIGGSILKELPLKIINKWYMKIIVGICGGLLGVLMIYYNIHIPSTGVKLDLRTLIFIIVNYIAPGIPVVITGLIIGIYRIVYGGINQATIVAIINIILFLPAFFVINKGVKNPWKNWFLKLAAIIIISIGSVFYLLKDMENAYLVQFNFIAAITVVGTLEYFLLGYVKRSNELLRMYKENATIDYLTGLNNTRNFDILLNSSFKSAMEKSEKLSCLMIDIDYFKKVNDTYGHAVGDIVLKGLAGILSESCRAFDIIGRVGGEEFCVLLLDCSPDRAFEIASRIRENVKKYNFLIGDHRTIKITVSIGIATYPDTVEDLDEIMKQADDALYKAKREGRDRVCDLTRCAC
ncbi:GGDEF domain-containing protein [Cellulosilyticum sp. I15G10I2]|uniref:GGDEF domain-containing protein n=1 Tax=Cellulosilyticum sp. I15G10I2 TaxID=1892843 RepID=UPI00085C3C93|nr:GGDEF domain-containing protein [Cellulosilyticum sp. I15G10I2]